MILKIARQDAAQVTLVEDDDVIQTFPAFRNRVQAMGIEEVLTAPPSPWQNPYVELLHGLDPPRMFGSHHHLQRTSLARPPVEIFSISQG